MSLGSGATLQPRLADGENVIRLTVTDSSGRSASDTVIITVNAPTSSGLPTANAGADRSVADTDHADRRKRRARRSCIDRSERQHRQLHLVARERRKHRESGQRRRPSCRRACRTVKTPFGWSSPTTRKIRASDTVVITVAAPAAVAPTANAGADRVIADTDIRKAKTSCSRLLFGRSGRHHRRLRLVAHQRRDHRKPRQRPQPDIADPLAGRRTASFSWWSPTTKATPRRIRCSSPSMPASSSPRWAIFPV